MDDFGRIVQAVGPTATIALLGIVALWKVFVKQSSDLMALGARMGKLEEDRLKDYKEIIEPHTRAMTRLSTAIENSPCGRAAGVWLKGNGDRREEERQCPHGEIGFERPTKGA